MSEVLIREFLLTDFEPCLGSVFTVRLVDGGSYPLTLFEATALPAGRWSGERRPPFQLKFRGPAEQGYLPQGIHALLHPTAGECPIALVPVGRDSEGYIYQAVFN